MEGIYEKLKDYQLNEQTVQDIIKNRRYYKANAGFHYLNVISTKLLIYLESNLLFYIYLVFDFVKLGHCKMKILVS
jgi:hypothetical protein